VRVNPFRRLPAALWRWGAVGVYALAIFVASSQSRIPSLPGRPSDKLLHAAAYAVLSLLVIAAAAKGRWRAVTGRVVLASAVACVLYGVSDELHQRFVPGRDASVGDVAADAVGAFGAAGAAYAWSIISRGSSRDDALRTPPR